MATTTYGADPAITTYGRTPPPAPIIAALTNADVMTFTDKAFKAPTVRAYPFQAAPLPAELSAEGREQDHARIGCRGERAVATLKTWKIVIKLRCSPLSDDRVGAGRPRPHHVENPTYQG